jgi:hypothetical protein
MGKDTELKRVSLKVPDVTKEWYEKKSKELGLNMSQYMTIALIRYKTETERQEVEGVDPRVEIPTDYELQQLI